MKKHVLEYLKTITLCYYSEEDLTNKPINELLNEDFINKVNSLNLENNFYSYMYFYEGGKHHDIYMKFLTNLKEKWDVDGRVQRIESTLSFGYPSHFQPTLNQQEKIKKLMGNELSLYSL